MNLNRKNARLLTAAIVVSITGLLGVQALMLVRNIRMQNQLFDQKVDNALSSIVRKLEARETVAMIYRISSGDSAEETFYFSDGQPNAGAGDSMHVWVNHQFAMMDSANSGRPPFQFGDSGAVFHRSRAGTSEVRMLRGSMVEPGLMLNDSLMALQGITLDKRGGNKVISMDFGNETSVTLNFDSLSVNPRRLLVERAMDAFSGVNRVPLKQRIDLSTLRPLIGETLQENGVDETFAYGIVSTDSNRFTVSWPHGSEKSLSQSSYRTGLFPHDFFAVPNELILFFPWRTRALLARLGFPMLFALLFLGMIAAVFLYVTRSLIRQRQFSGLLTDFINNMTHEFKTPISTISLASETLSSPLVLEDRDRLKRYAGMIRDESVRMRKQVEKILEMAALEGGDLELTREGCSLHHLIEEAAERMSLAAEQRGGSITLNLNAHRDRVLADALHLGNVLFNLLDNALKYTRRPPDIGVTTESREGSLLLSVRDNGIGMKAETLRHVFDKYYRAPTGNVHDVKGFGLGLSYVKLIVEAHDGRVWVESVEGLGSTFWVKLPMNREGHE